MATRQDRRGGNDGDRLRRSVTALPHRGGLTQEELAERAGVSTRGISDLERGAPRAARKDTLQLLLEGFKLTPKQTGTHWSRRHGATLKRHP